MPKVKEVPRTLVQCRSLWNLIEICARGQSWGSPTNCYENPRDRIYCKKLRTQDYNNFNEATGEV